MYVFEYTDSPDVQSINHTLGYIDTYLFISLVDMESITNILVSSCKEKSFCSSRIFSFRKSEHFFFGVYLNLDNLSIEKITHFQ